MKKIGLLTLVPLALIGTGVAYAETTNVNTNTFNPYMSVKLGYGTSSWEDSTVDPAGISAMVAIGAGYELRPVVLRGEFEFSFSALSADIDEDDFPFYNITGTNDQTIMTAMANLYVDFLQDYKLKPYVGLGLGFTRVSEDISATITQYSNGYSETFTADGASTGFAYGLHAGLGFNITARLAGDFGVRYIWNALDEYTIDLFGVNVGLRYSF